MNKLALAEEHDFKITASEDIRRAGINFKKGKNHPYKAGQLSPATLAQINAVKELSIETVSVADESTKESPIKETK